MRNHRTLAKSAVVAIAVTVAFTLSGCFPNPLDQLTDQIESEIAEGGAEKLVEGMTGGDLDIETGELPKDFPSDVPLVDGQIVSAVSMGLEEGKTWSVTLQVGDSAAAMDEARQQLVAAGFEESLWSDASGMSMGMFATETMSVTITGLLSDDEEQVISYQVIKGNKTE